MITQRWWENERHKYILTVSEAVEAECVPRRPRDGCSPPDFLEEASLFPVHETIVKVAKLLAVPRAIRKRPEWTPFISLLPPPKNETLF